MARNLIPSDTTIKAIRAGNSRKRLSDGDGLFLLLFVNGGSHGWRFDYRFEGKRKMLSFGTYPDTTLAVARHQAQDARELVAQGIDPSEQRKAQRSVQLEAKVTQARRAQGLPPLESFEAVACEWFEVKRSAWAKGYADKIIARLEAVIFPYMGHQPVASI